MSESEDHGLPKWRPFNERPLSQILSDHADDLGGPRTVELRFKLREAAAILKRYEDAPVREFFIGNEGYALDSDKNGHAIELDYLDGQSVRLVREPARRDG